MFRCAICSVLDDHGFGVDGFLAEYAFESGENAAVVVLIAPHPTSRKEREKWGTRVAFFVSVGPELLGVLRNKCRDPSLGVARLRVRLRCLGMTIVEFRKDSSEHMSHVVSWALNRETTSVGKLRDPTSGGRRTVLRGFRGVKEIYRRARAPLPCGA
jgi:hypothetical protein